MPRALRKTQRPLRQHTLPGGPPRIPSSPTGATPRRGSPSSRDHPGAAGLARQHPQQLHCSGDVAPRHLPRRPRGRSGPAGPTGKERAAPPLSSACPLQAPTPLSVWGSRMALGGQLGSSSCSWKSCSRFCSLLFMEWVFRGGVVTPPPPPRFPAHHVTSGMVLRLCFGWLKESPANAGLTLK